MGFFDDPPENVGVLNQVVGCKGPGSERSRHINIRHFWLAERVEGGEAIVEHLSTKDMWANALTKPTQGAQFVKERAGLTNWD